MSKIYPIAVPKWGIEMVEGTINTWNKSEGDAVARGDEVFEMESDKIVNVWDSPVDGVLRRVIATAGDTHPVGALLGVIAAQDVSDEDIEAFIAGYTGATPEEATPAPSPAPAAGGNDAYTRSSPSVRRLADERGVDLNTLVGSGRRGRITEDDVRAAAAGDGGEEVDIIPLTATRKSMARRLTEAKRNIPHFYLSANYEIDGLLAHRGRLNEGGAVKVSVNDLLVWCVGRALIREPRVNVNLVGDDIHRFKRAHIAVAIATDEGLYAATLRGVEAMSPAEIATATGALADKARRGKLEKADLSGASFTVSNLGMFGVSHFTAIVNPPMGAILALGQGEPRCVVKNGQPAIATRLSATLSCDHRVIDGAVGAKFLRALGEEIAALG